MSTILNIGHRLLDNMKLPRCFVVDYVHASITLEIKRVIRLNETPLAPLSVKLIFVLAWIDVIYYLIMVRVLGSGLGNIGLTWILV